jgi:hypothetical protein
MMSSFDLINYSLRPSKNIERQLVFEGVRILQQYMTLEHLVYVGFGSIWFTDFVLAHKQLAVDDMVSIEKDDIGYKRAIFNSPYATVRVKLGISSDVLPTLYVDDEFKARPWMVWLDYDHDLNEIVTQDVQTAILNAPMNSVLLITFNGLDHKYGKPRERPDRIRQLLGAAVPDDLTREKCEDELMQETLADLTLDFMKSIAAEFARPGGFIPAFRLIYRDGAPMVTVGGVLPAKGAARSVTDVVNQATWPCRPLKAIRAPHLTMREAMTLQSQLPRTERLSREIVRGLGFDLEDEQIEVFETYYRQYPAFAQIIG